MAHVRRIGRAHWPSTLRLPKIRPCRSGGTSVLVDGSAKPVSPTHHNMVELGGFTSLRQSSQGCLWVPKLRPRRSNNMSVLVDDSAEPVSPTYHQMVELGGFKNLRQSSQRRR